MCGDSEDIFVHFKVFVQHKPFSRSSQFDHTIGIQSWIILIASPMLSMLGQHSLFSVQVCRGCRCSREGSRQVHQNWAATWCCPMLSKLGCHSQQSGRVCRGQKCFGESSR